MAQKFSKTAGHFLPTLFYRSFFMQNRTFVTKSGIVLAGATAAVASNAYAQGTDETIKAVIIGCGGRGTGAAATFLNQDTEIMTYYPGIIEID